MTRTDAVLACGLGLAAALAATGCAERFEAPAQPSEWTEGEGHRWRPLAVSGDRPAGFTSVPPSWSGVDFANRLSEERLVENQMRTNGSGVAIGDVDGDGRPDLYLARLDGPNALYRNLGDWRFEEITERASPSGASGGSAALALADRFSTGAAFADMDGDGDLDLLVTTLGSRNALFLGDGSGGFAESPASGLTGERGSMTPALADIDGDGDLDLYVTSYKSASVLDLFPPQERTFSRTVVKDGDLYTVAPQFVDHYELMWRGSELRRLERAEPDELWLNDGSGRFEAAPIAGPRFLTAEGEPLAEAPREWGLAARFADLDLDGDPDLYVCNDLHSPDRVWLNDGAGTFREISPWAIRTTSASCMAVDVSDVDRDGDLDLFTADMLSRSSRLRKTQEPVARTERALPGEIRGTVQVPRNALLLARGDGTYAEAARYAGVEASDWSWSALFLDVDLDGYEDLLVPNGHIRDLMDADTERRLQRTFIEDWRRNLLFYEPLPLRNAAFRNRGDLTFEEVGEAWGFGPEEDISHGTALGDLDGDGDLDAVVNRLDRPALLLRNDASRPRTAVRLRGTAPNTRGIGAKIRVRGGGLPEQLKEIAAGGAYLSSSEPLASFAAGDGQGLELEVEWPDGARSRVSGVEPNRLYEIDRAGAGAGPSRPPAPPTGAASGAPGAVDAARDTAARRAAPWFVEVEDFAYQHAEPPFDEFRRQPLLPMRLAQLGPGLAWQDLDGDGDADLLIGSGRGAAPGLFRNDGGRLTQVVLPAPQAPLDQTAILPLADGRGGARVVVGLSSYEEPDPAAARGLPVALRVDLAPGAIEGALASPIVRPVATGDRDATGPLAAADYDGDGRLDLFVGGRVIPGEYAAPASSRLLRGLADGAFEPDAAASAVFRDLGLVSAATFSDLDGDGDPDLVLGLDWGPIRVFINRGGRFEDATEARGLADTRGRWNAVATGDFDADGRPDIVATSWGRNTEYRPSRESPIFAYYGDLDRNGSVEVIEAQRDPRIGDLAPLVGFDRLARAFPPAAARSAGFSQYADASLRDALGPPLSEADRVEAWTLDHVVALERGGRYEVVPLPAEAQLAPAFGIAVADADGDGEEDIFLAQNFFATDEDTPRYDAGRGLWLRGDGAGGFEPVPGAASGIAVYGDQRSAAVADFDGDARIDLVIGQNGAGTRLYRNAGARPGLRVRLRGLAGNPSGVGAVVRVQYADGGLGPAREVKAGSGHLSHDDPVPVLGLAGTPRAVRVTWPGGSATETLVPAGAREIEVAAPGATP